MKTIQRLIISILFFTFIAGCASQGSYSQKMSHFTSPYQKIIKPKTKVLVTSKDCSHNVKPFTDVLNMPSRYEGSGSARDQENPKSKEIYLEQITSIRDFEMDLSAMTDTYLQTGRTDRSIMTCSLNWMDAWANADAMLQEAQSSTGRGVRKWFLSSVSANYLKLNRPRSADQNIKKWIDAMAHQVIAEYQHYFHEPERINNHIYWAGLAVMLSGVVTGNDSYIDWGIASYDAGVAQIDAEGFMSNELRRDSRALLYHNFSLQPLVMLAEIGESNGLEMYPKGDFAIRRLADVVMKGLKDDAIFVSKTNSDQNKERLISSNSLAWMEPYQERFGVSQHSKQLLESLRPMKHSYLGGDITLIFDQ